MLPYSCFTFPIIVVNFYYNIWVRYTYSPKLFNYLFVLIYICKLSIMLFICILNNLYSCNNDNHIKIYNGVYKL